MKNSSRPLAKMDPNRTRSSSGTSGSSASSRIRSPNRSQLSSRSRYRPGGSSAGGAGSPAAWCRPARSPSAGSPSAERPRRWTSAGWPSAGWPSAGWPSAGWPSSGWPTAGIPAPAAGWPLAGSPVAGAPAAGWPAAGPPVAGPPVAGAGRSRWRRSRSVARALALAASRACSPARLRRLLLGPLGGRRALGAASQARGRTSVPSAPAATRVHVLIVPTETRRKGPAPALLDDGKVNFRRLLEVRWLS